MPRRCLMHSTINTDSADVSTFMWLENLTVSGQKNKAYVCDFLCNALAPTTRPALLGAPILIRPANFLGVLY